MFSEIAFRPRLLLILLISNPFGTLSLSTYTNVCVCGFHLPIVRLCAWICGKATPPPVVFPGLGHYLNTSSRISILFGAAASSGFGLGGCGRDIQMNIRSDCCLVVVQSREVFSPCGRHKRGYEAPFAVRISKRFFPSPVINGINGLIGEGRGAFLHPCVVGREREGEIFKNSSASPDFGFHSNWGRFFARNFSNRPF